MSGFVSSELDDVPMGEEMSYYGNVSTQHLNIRFEQMEELMALLGIVRGKNVETLEEVLKTVKALSSEIEALKQRVDYLERRFVR
jgi:hypothetical protein